MGGAGPASADRFLGWEYDSARGYRLVYSLGSNYSRYGAIPDHTVFFLSYPYTNTICLWSSYYNWHGAIENLCPGYSSSYKYQANRRNVADTANNCWRWDCANGTFMMGGGECVSQAVCTQRGLVWDDNRCTTSSYCAGWTGYNQNAYTLTLKGSCYEYRCRTGGFASATDRSCKNASSVNIANDPVRSKGGSYVHNDANGDGILHTCTSTQYVSGSSGSYSCAEMTVKPESSFDKCWQCQSKAAIVQCVANNTACE